MNQTKSSTYKFKLDFKNFITAMYFAYAIPRLLQNFYFDWIFALI